MVDNLTVVIRAVGEATTELCYEQIKKVVSEQNIFWVKNVTPFYKAIIQSFQIGIAEGNKWTIIIDADELLSPIQIEKIVKESDKLTSKHKRVFCINGLLYDKALMIPRIGVHIYQTRYLDKALSFAEGGKAELRPETYIKIQMGNSGFRTYVSDIVLGLHDFYQRPIDLLRKGFLHKKKHADYDETFEKWKALAGQDKDFFWLAEGAKMSDKVSVFPGVDSKIISSFFQQYQQDLEFVLIKNEEVDKLLAKYSNNEDKVVWKKYFGPDDFFEKLKSIFGGHE